MLNGVLNDLEKIVIQESMDRFKKEKEGTGENQVKGLLLLDR